MPPTHTSAASSNQKISSDLCICNEAVISHFFRVLMNVTSEKIVQVDLQPFLTQSQLENGFELDWFKSEHEAEMFTLLQPILKTCVDRKKDVTVHKDDKSKDCVLTGESVRLACTFKAQEVNICLLSISSSAKRKHTAGKNQPNFQDVTLLNEKIVVFVCPRASSSVLQLSQLLNNDTDKTRRHQDISEYFQCN
ncbi:uncharacterized protein LOC131946392 isoform X2 [Physella acuta]|uniref:uncharacterized protein LOC131946392 isoform X2 n=1 Tax=Physella acuta TaxID=109671 RepID=UPI0027DCFA87|nr:uncharacterized protein LOC131946392 isoform X2 [Physella acuta]